MKRILSRSIQVAKQRHVEAVLDHLENCGLMNESGRASTTLARVFLDIPKKGGNKSASRN